MLLCAKILASVQRDFLLYCYLLTNIGVSGVFLYHADEPNTSHISLTGKGKVTEVHLHHTCSAVIGAKRENWRYVGRVVKVIKDVTVVALCYTWSFLGHFGSRGEL